MALTVNITGAASSAVGYGQVTVGPLPIIGSITPLSVSSNLQSGNNTFAVPTGAVGVIVTPPASNSIVIKAKTTSGDTGINIPQNASTVFAFDTANLPADFYLNAASNTTGYTQLLFF